MPYSITRENAARDLEALKAILDNDGIVEGDVKVLEEIADSIEEQLPKPAPAEPTGDVVVFVLGRPWWPRVGGVHWLTVEHNNNPPTWGELTDEVDSDQIVIYRNETELTEMASKPMDAGLAAGPWRDGYTKGTDNTRTRHIDILTALKPDLITAVEKTAIDKAIAAIKADVENTVTGRGCPS